MSRFLSLPLFLLLPLFTYAQDGYDYEKDIAPIFETYCVKCHGPDEQKSGYRLDTYKALLTPGDSEEKPIVPGFPTGSPLIEYLLLPKSDDYAMPPEDEDTPSGDDILKIAHWIYDGAKSASDERANLPIEELLGEDAMVAVESLRSQGIVVQKTAEDEPSLFVDLQDRALDLNDTHIDALKTIAPWTHELKAARLAHSISDFRWIEDFTALTRLDLSHSAFGDGNIASANALAQLQHLNLFGSRLTSKGLEQLQVPIAGTLHIGGTRVSGRALQTVQAENSNRQLFGNPNLNATLAITEDARSNSTTFNPMPEIEPGRQVSPSGIRHSFLVCGRLTAIFNEDSQVTWLGPSGSRDGMVLENGNVLISAKNIAREYLKDTHQIVWQYSLDPRNKELGTVNRLPNGNTLVVERGNLPRLLEIDPAGAIVVNVPLQPETDNGHMQTRMARKLPNGNYLVPHLLAFKVKEYTRSGEIVNTINTDLASLGGREAENWPFTAIRLPDGNTVVNLTHGNKTVEFAPDGSVAWVCDNDDVDGRYSDPCGGQRLPNGNTVVGSYGQRDPDQVKVFEVNADKEVVWEFFHPDVKAHQIHILTTNGEPVKPVYR